ncbi:hypothetical protein GF362_04140 [Candidatus Dojkabacteria bacterium]|nr:hypothetical protein [Candidatus Dojkabacteria bacterium]
MPPEQDINLTGIIDTNLEFYDDASERDLFSNPTIVEDPVNPGSQIDLGSLRLRNYETYLEDQGVGLAEYAGMHSSSWFKGAFNRDSDGDGLTNRMERLLGLKVRDPDSDGDGISDLEEILAGSNPLKLDSDGDGLMDWVEFDEQYQELYRLNPSVRNMEVYENYFEALFPEGNHGNQLFVDFISEMNGILWGHERDSDSDGLSNSV